MSFIWDLRGTPTQNKIVDDALRLCDFPFEFLEPKLLAEKGRRTIPVDWQDLSRYSATASLAAGVHQHIHDDTGDTGHPIEARNQVLGLAWYSGRVTLDLSLENDPNLGIEVFLAEGAHMVDFFYMTEEDRLAIGRHWDPTDRPDIDWFDVGPYESWMGEAFMGLFTAAFAPGVNMSLTQFQHKVTPELAQFTRRLLLRAPEAPPTPPAPPVVEEPILDNFPYDTMDAWANKKRPWWSRYSRTAADAYTNWRTDPRASC